jgi:peptidyl-prolyl cis-trans isomerase SurA
MLRLVGPLLAIALCVSLQATIIDRIAIVVNNQVIKDSDIERDLRVVDFLNQEKLVIDPATRRTAANRLIDQVLIRREIRVGEYQTPPQSEADKLFNQIKKDRFANQAALQKGLERYGLTESQLKQYLLWQLTVLRFVDQRFRPAVQMTDEDIEKYYREHVSQFQKAGSSQPESLEEARGEIQQSISGDRMNQLFYAWLEQRRKGTVIQYREEGLK